ncbi:MAG: helix-turn-helix domain-containing protein [Clostridia bacterium]|nr:helix-turn-helix domain-containing protein [Clostridia bacterium]
MKNIGEQIAALRRARSMTQEELASVIGVSAQSVSKWENSNTMPDVSLLPVLAGIFGVSIDYLFGEERRASSFSFNDAPEVCYRALLETYAGCWECDPGIPPSAKREFCDALEANPSSNSGVCSDRRGAVFADSGFAYVSRLENRDALALLGDPELGTFFSSLGRPSFRQIVKLLWEECAGDSVKSFTAASVADRCGLTVEEAARELHEIAGCRIMYLEERTVDLGGGETLAVYSPWNLYQTRLFLFPILHLADRMLHASSSWYCLRG